MQQTGSRRLCEIANFRLGASTILRSLEMGENGGEGGRHAGNRSAAGKMRTAYIAIGHTAAQRGREITN